MTTLFKILGVFAAVSVALFISGFVTLTLWNWLIVPTFDLPELNFASALGLALIITWFTDKTLFKDREGIELVVAVSIWILFVLGYGFILTFFI